MCAFWLHLVVFVILTDAATWRLPEARPPVPVEVDLLPETGSPVLPDVAPVSEEPATDTDMTALREAPVPEPVPSGSKAGPVDEAAPTWVTATTLLAADVLRDPRSRQAREALATLAGADGREQICALEAMEQLRRDRPGFRPTRLAPHAFRNATFRERMVHVTAGAVRSNRIWYEIAYRCRLETDKDTIVGFEYALGAPVDRALWDEHGLAPIH
ncbi:DUF930 domain-containing protein [Roseibium sp. Sym1]|uniref:DUF930 domain-containing protein n=1 Tax=Roseibium sp. Sym1 TaxID=3016006 RepID=UPI0022B39557|nr:DUF930 domain-containing protein [Roseibium sp. Sym1]